MTGGESKAGRRHRGRGRRLQRYFRDLETGKSILRKYINGTVGFIQLGTDLGRSPKVLMRMLGPKGNPQARGLFEIVAHLQKIEGTMLEVIDGAAA